MSTLLLLSFLEVELRLLAESELLQVNCELEHIQALFYIFVLALL